MILGVIAFLGILGAFQLLNPTMLKDWSHLKAGLDVMGFTGIVSYLLMASILPLFSPLSLVIVSGSAAFGPVFGFFLSYLGCIINAALTFLLLKHLSLADRWEKTEKRRKIGELVRRHSFAFVLCLQLAIVIPFPLINTLAAGSGIPWKRFMKATAIGICPSLLLYSVLGEKLTANMVSPRVYFAGVFVMALLIVVVALRRKRRG